MSQWTFQTPTNQHRPYWTIVISTEGTVTEPEYFAKLNSMKRNAYFDIVRNNGNGSDPTKVLDRMRKYLQEFPLEEEDEAWIVVDKDRWTDAQMNEVEKWENEDTRHHIAVSIRRFEHWLKLHIQGDKELEKKFYPLISGTNKHIPDDFLTKPRILTAIATAKRLHTTVKNVGNVFELVESFFK